MLQFPLMSPDLADSPVAMRQLQPSGERLRDYRHARFGMMAEARATLSSPKAAAPAPTAARGQG